MKYQAEPHLQSSYGSGARRLVAAALLVGWWPIVIAETIYGSLDNFALEAIAGNSVRFAVAAVVGLAGATVLVAAGLAMAYLARRGSPILAWLGGALSVALAVGAAGFVQLHLIVLELTAPNLDRAAMNTFVETNLQGSGLWKLPQLLLIGGFIFGLPIQMIALRRARVISWGPVLLAATGIIVHGIDPLGLWELVGLSLIAVAVSLVGFRVRRMSDAEWTAYQ